MSGCLLMTFPEKYDDAQDQVIYERLYAGWLWQQEVAHILRAMGLRVYLFPFSWRGPPPAHITDPKERLLWRLEAARKYIDTFDLIVEGLPCEVKACYPYFTCVADYPRKRVLTDTVKGYDQKNVKPWIYLIVCTANKAMICTRGDLAKTEGRWFRELVKDTKKKTQDWSYACPIEHMQDLKHLVADMLARKKRLRETFIEDLELIYVNEPRP